MAVGELGRGLQAELNRLANGGTYPTPDKFLDAQGAANKWASLPIHGTVHASPTAATTGVYAAGTTGADGGTGVGATITAAANGAGYTVDGHAMQLGERVLYRLNTDAKTNGIYTVTSLGSASTKWVVTRSTDHDNGSWAGQVGKGDWVTVDQGTVNAGKTFYINNDGTGINGDIVIGTDVINYVEIPKPNGPYDKDIIGALNYKLDPLLDQSQYEDLNGICNELAGTSSFEAGEALRRIP